MCVREKTQNVNLNFLVFLCTGASSVGINPKINNINLAYNSTEYDILWLSDSNIISKLGTLQLSGY